MPKLPLVLLLATVGAGCDQKPAPSSDPAKPTPSAPADTATPTASAAPAASVPSTPTGHVVTFSGAGYAKEKLDECVDFTLTVASADAGANAEKGMEKLRADFVKDASKGEKRVVLKKSCAEQLASSPALASCHVVLNLSDAGTVQLTMDARYYNSATLRADTYQRDCLEQGGDWKALPPDSPEMRRARSEEALRRVDEAIKQLE